MAMSKTLTLLLAGLAGTALGTFFFGGLWWTIRQSVISRHPALWVFASFLLRTSVALAGFYLAGGGQMTRLLACLAGFLLARLGVTWLTRLPPAAREIHADSEARHAP